MKNDRKRERERGTRNRKASRKRERERQRAALSFLRAFYNLNSSFTSVVENLDFIQFFFCNVSF